MVAPPDNEELRRIFATPMGRLAGRVVRNRRPVIGAWGLVIVLAAMLAPRASDVLVGLEDEAAGSESARVAHLLGNEFPESEAATLMLLVRNPDVTVLHLRFLAVLVLVAEEVRAVPGVARVVTLNETGDPSLIGRSNHTTLAFVTLSTQSDDASIGVYLDIKERLGDLALPAGYEVVVTGGVAALHDIESASEADLYRSEAVAFPLAVVI